MKLLLIKFVLFFTVAFNLSADLSAKKLEAFYKIELGIINVGSIKWRIDLDGDSYITSILLKDKGLLSGLYQFTGEYLSEGKILKGEFVSSRYKQFWETKKKTREVEILFNKEMVSVLILKPKENESPRVDYLRIRCLTDPLSSFLNILANNTNNFKTIDGRRLYKMSLDSKRIDGNVVTKKIFIKDYFNIWADHKRNDLKFIATKQDLSKEDVILPKNIKINNGGLVFKLTKI